MKLSIAVPSNRDHSPHFVASLVALVQNHSVNGVANRTLKDLRINLKTGCSNIATARCDLVQEAIDQGFTHILFIDDDMTFPLDMLDHLCKYDTPVVAANCCKKVMEPVFTAIGFDGKRIDSIGKTGYEQVQRVGTGIMLIDLSIFEKLPKPWFNFWWSKEAQRLVGEDYYFCRLLAENKIPIIIDHDVSQHIGHVGTYIYGMGGSCLVPRPA